MWTQRQTCTRDMKTRVRVRVKWPSTRHGERPPEEPAPPTPWSQTSACRTVRRTTQSMAGSYGNPSKHTLAYSRASVKCEDWINNRATWKTPKMNRGPQTSVILSPSSRNKSELTSVLKQGAPKSQACSWKAGPTTLAYLLMTVPLQGSPVCSFW